jgi:hypothetical protein
VLRYLALSCAIVFGAIVVLLALPRPPSPDRPDHSVSGRGRAGPGEVAPADRPAGAFAGAAPWALSVVPECFRQRASFAGRPSFARAHLPATARRVPDGEVLRTADCTLTIRGDAAELQRGADRFVVPAPARFYVAGPRLVLDQRDGAREEVRLYVLRSGSVPSFRPARPSAGP